MPTDCTNQANTRCRRRYAGSCKKACDDTELEIPGCEAGCKCCGCKITTACINEGGYCKVGKGDCKGRMTNKCFGRHCYCCIPGEFHIIFFLNCINLLDWIIISDHFFLCLLSCSMSIIIYRCIPGKFQATCLLNYLFWIYDWRSLNLGSS